MERIGYLGVPLNGTAVTRFVARGRKEIAEVFVKLGYEPGGSVDAPPMHFKIKSAFRVSS